MVEVFNPSGNVHGLEYEINARNSGSSITIKGKEDDYIFPIETLEDPDESIFNSTCEHDEIFGCGNTAEDAEEQLITMLVTEVNQYEKGGSGKAPELVESSMQGVHDVGDRVEAEVENIEHILEGEGFGDDIARMPDINTRSIHDGLNDDDR